MDLKKQKGYYFLIAIIEIINCKDQESMESAANDALIHYYLISITGLVLFMVSIFLYWLEIQQEKTVEFTVFNSQYLGKQSVRSTSEHDFPNFDVDIMKHQSQQNEDGEQRSSERRRRRRKIDKIVKKQQSQAGLDTTPNSQL